MSCRPTAPSGTVLILATALIMLGVVMVSSASASLEQPLWPQNLMESTAGRQIIFAAAALGAMWLAYVAGYRWLSWRSAPEDCQTSRLRVLQPSTLLIGLTVMVLIAALIPGIGIERHGARRWLPLGLAGSGLGFQPSEVAKFGLVAFLAVWLAQRQGVMGSFRRGMLPAVATLSVVVVLVVIEDLGTAALIATVGGVMILAAGGRLWHALVVALPGVAGFAGMIYTKPYRLERLTTFTDIWADPLGTGYHAIQSLIAIASGGWMGRGLGAGLQKYGYLPEAHNDFIFAIVCEELGIVGGLAVIGLFAWLVLCGGRIATHAPDLTGKLLALGITMMVGLQAVMNIAVVTVSVPTKGISLPFISAGGSGLICTAVAMGLLASVGKDRGS